MRDSKDFMFKHVEFKTFDGCISLTYIQQVTLFVVAWDLHFVQCGSSAIMSELMPDTMF